MSGLEEAATVRRSRWVSPLLLLRAAACIPSALLLSLAIDLWVRTALVRRPWRDEHARMAALNRVIRAWGRALFRLSRVALDLKVTVEGTPPASGRYFILCNHQSSIDVPALISVFRRQNLKFVAMEELRHGKPGVSVGLRNGGFVFVAKRNLGEDLARIEEFARGMERFDGSPTIFPEGRRTDDGSLLPFRWAGSEVIRRTARLPILPVAIDGLAAARTLKTYPLAYRSRVTIRIGEPIPFEETEKDPRATFARVEKTIRGYVDEIRRRAV